MADVVVAGGGMAGLAAAVSCAEHGAEVELIEKADEPGGSAALSGGLVWTEPTLDRLLERNPLGDEQLNRILIENYDDSVSWLMDRGVEMSPPMTGLFGTGRGRRIQPDMKTFVATMLEAAAGAGVEVFTGQSLDSVLLDDAARVRGVRTRSATGFAERESRGVVLATGGFPANAEMLTRYVSPYADRLYPRCNPMSTGDGIEAGQRAGAASSSGMHAFYGHLLPAPPASVEPDDFIGLTQYYSIHCLLVNKLGERFVDETEADEVNAQALAKQPDALGFIVLDSRLADRVTAPAADGFPEVDRHGEIRRVGGRVLEAETLEGLADEISSAGGNGWRTAETVEQFNRLVSVSPERLPVPRAQRRQPVEEGPFVAVPVTPAVTFTEGGLRIDPSARVLDRSGRPIDGLYAAGGDGGGVYHERYAGGLSLSLVFGRVAGETAAASLEGTP